MPTKTRAKGTRSTSQDASTAAPFDPTTFPTPALDSRPLRMSYNVGRGEKGVLTFEPYKSLLLPHWRFRTADVARGSSADLKRVFDSYVERGDFVGADMTRKFIQMGMTRAGRYAAHKGGKKYGEGGGRVEEGERSEAMLEKGRAKEVFRAVWRACIEDGRYGEMKSGFAREKKEWEKQEKRRRKDEGGGEDEVKEEG